MSDTAVKETLLTADDIDRRTYELAEQIVEDYQDCDGLLLIGVLLGAAKFIVELQEALFVLGVDVEMDFIKVSSYGNNQESSRKVKILSDIDTEVTEVRGKHVLIVEDIYHTGWTLEALIKVFSARGPASLSVITMLSKPSEREIEVEEVKYIGFDVEGWVEGHGLDTAGLGRGNPDVVRVVG